MDIVNLLILSLSILVSVSYTVIQNVTGKKSGLTSFPSKALFNSIIFVVIILGIAVMNGGVSGVSQMTLICGIAYGICAALSYVTALLSYATGPMNFTVLITYCIALLIPAIVGPWIWPDSNPVTVMQWIGVALLIVSLVLGLKKSDGAKFNVKWLICVLLSALAGGGLGIIQQVHQRSDGQNEMNMMLIISFAVATVLTLAVSLVSAKVLNSKPLREFRRVDCVAAVGCGICLGIANVVNLYLSGVLPAVVFFPTVNGGIVILSTVVSLVFFKEKLNLRQSIGLALGIVSIFLICGII